MFYLPRGKKLGRAFRRVRDIFVDTVREHRLVERLYQSGVVKRRGQHHRRARLQT